MYEHIFDIQFSFLYFQFKIDGHFNIFSLPFCCLSTSKMILKLTHEQHTLPLTNSMKENLSKLIRFILHGWAYILFLAIKMLFNANLNGGNSSWTNSEGFGYQALWKDWLQVSMHMSHQKSSNSKESQQIRVVRKLTRHINNYSC